MPVIFPEIHAEIGEVLNDYNIVFRSKLTNDPQLFIGKANP